jgi:putative SOS response-associated peptidase YedK
MPAKKANGRVSSNANQTGGRVPSGNTSFSEKLVHHAVVDPEPALPMRGFDVANIGEAWKPVYNFRSEGREFTSGRCLIVADGFYEFTDPEDKKKKRKDKWLFTKRGEPWFCIAGIWRANKDVGEAFTMLTMEPGPDIAPYHDRQIAVLDRANWAGWLDPTVSSKTLLKPLPPGTLHVEQIG